MQVKINGKVAELPENSCINDLLLARQIPQDVVIVELNGEIIHRPKWETMKLNDDDSIELIRIIAGG